MRHANSSLEPFRKAIFGQKLKNTKPKPALTDIKPSPGNFCDPGDPHDEKEFHHNVEPLLRLTLDPE